MYRLLWTLAVVTLVLTLGASEAPAQTWPSVQTPVEGPGWRGPGFYLSWIKILGCWAVFLSWVYSTDWINRDGQEKKLDYLRWNPIVFGCFMVAFVLVWVVPYFWLGFSLLLIAYLGPFVAYVIYRNSRVDYSERVFTPAHIRYWVSTHGAKIGLKISAEARDPHEKGPPVKVMGRGGPTERDENARLLAARQTLGMLPAREIIFTGLSSRASAIMLDYNQQSVGVRYLVDGVWLGQEPIDRETGDPALETLKVLCGLNPQDRQGRQQGTFGVELESIDYTSMLACQGTKTGERAVIQLEDKKIRFDELDELGMRPKMQEELRELLSLERGFVLFSAMPAHGLRSTADVVIRRTDRFTREFMAVEEETKPYERIENCPITTYKTAEGQTPASILPKVFRAQPNVLVIRDLVDGQTVGLLCREAADSLLILSTVRAKDSIDGLLRVVALGVQPGEFARAISAVFGQRLVRKLCDACKEAYAPTPQVLAQLGIPKGRVEAFYRPPQEPEEVCEECGGIGYKGRTAIFELLKVGDNVRRALESGSKPDVLREAARKDGMRSLQEEGILLVAKGVTSLPELMRVLKL